MDGNRFTYRIERFLVLMLLYVVSTGLAILVMYVWHWPLSLEILVIIICCFGAAFSVFFIRVLLLKNPYQDIDNVFWLMLGSFLFFAALSMYKAGVFTPILK